MAERSIGIKPNILKAKLEGTKDNINITIEVGLFITIIIIFLKNIKGGEWVLITKIYNFKINLKN